MGLGCIRICATKELIVTPIVLSYIYIISISMYAFPDVVGFLVDCFTVLS